MSLCSWRQFRGIKVSFTFWQFASLKKNERRVTYWSGGLHSKPCKFHKHGLILAKIALCLSVAGGDFGTMRGHKSCGQDDQLHFKTSKQPESKTPLNCSKQPPGTHKHPSNVRQTEDKSLLFNMFSTCSI